MMMKCSSICRIATSLLVGLSVYASFGGGGGGGPTVHEAVKSSRELRSMGFDELAMMTPPVPVPKTTCNIEDAKWGSAVLKPASANIKNTAKGCQQSCRKFETCTAWRWCEDTTGCIDIRGGAVPYHGCLLEAENLRPSGIPSDRTNVLERLAPHSYTAGFIKHRNYNQSTFLRTQSMPGTKMTITTYVPQLACTISEGPRIGIMSILNKQDYARWHSYNFHLEAGTADPELRPRGAADEGSWNKIGIIQKLLETNTEAEMEWLLWMEPDAIFDDPSFTFPFEFYRGKDIITVADGELAAQGHAKELSTGVLLLRNSKWTRKFVKELADFAKANIVVKDEEDSAGSNDPVATAMMAIMKRRGLAESLSHFRFEKEFCLACDWRKVDLKASSQIQRTTTWGDENKRWKLFISRFFDCEMCWKGPTPTERLARCLQSYHEHYQFAYCRFDRMTQAIEREAQQGTFLQQLEFQQIPAKGFNYSAFNQQSRKDTHILASPQRLRVNSSQACYEECLKLKKCGRWIFCFNSLGCDNMGTFSGSFPLNGCELSAIDHTRSPYEWNRGPQFSSFASGYISGDHPLRGKWRKLAKKSASPHQGVVMATGLPTAPCSTPYGDLVIKLAIENRQDYVRIHSQELHVMAETVDPTLRMGAWQKLGLVRKILHEVPRERAEWIVWADMDVILNDMLFDIPFHKYEGKDLVVWGNKDLLLQGDVLNGINAGVFFLRNSDWSRKLLDAWTQFGGFPPDLKYDELLRENIKNFDIGMLDQNAIAYLVMQQPEYVHHMAFEEDFCINCWYKDAFKSHIPQPPFIVHFAGCQVCSGFHPEKLGDCDREVVRLYVDSHEQLRRYVASKAVSKYV